MYSWEIDSVMKQSNYTISSDAYINICSTSPQIIRIHYEAFGDYFEICTGDNYCWKFKVYKGEKGNEN